MIYSNSSCIFSTLCCFCCCFWFFALFCFVQVVQPLPKIDCNVGLVNYAYTRIQRICSIRVLFIILTLLFFIYKIIFDFLKLFFFFSEPLLNLSSFLIIEHLTNFLDLFAMLKLILSNLDLVGPSKFDSHLNALRVKWLKVTTFGSLRFFGI